jgi:hypothetical protein
MHQSFGVAVTYTRNDDVLPPPLALPATAACNAGALQPATSTNIPHLRGLRGAICIAPHQKDPSLTDEPA